MELIREVIGPDNGNASAAQMCARAVILLIFGIACVWVSGRRTFSQASPLDIIVAIVIGSNISRAMTGSAAFFPGLIATLFLAVLHRLMAWVTVRSKHIASLVKGDPIILVEDGTVNDAALRKEGITRSDLAEAVHLGQIEHIEDVRLAILEGGGKISIVPMETHATKRPIPPPP
jgi:uncharacterized membrane protein YcaP (DUF421 family)